MGEDGGDARTRRPTIDTRAAAGYRVVLLAAALVLVGLLFRQLLTLLLAVLITVIIAIPLSAAATKLERRGVPRAAGAALALVLGLAAIAGLFALVIPTLADQVETFIDDVPGIVDSLQERIRDLTGAEPGAVGERVQDFLEGLVDDPSQLLGSIASIGINVVVVIASLVFVLLAAFYMAMQPQPLVDGVLRFFPPERRPEALRVMKRLRTSWIGWMRGVLVDMVVTGVLLYVGLSLADLRFALAFAVFSALLVVIPYFGAIVGGIPPVLFALADSPGKALLVLGIYVLIQQIESNVTIPLVMSRTARLHPAAIAVGVVMVGALFGFVGLIVAVPILSAIWILAEELWIRPMEARHPAPDEGPAPVSRGAARAALEPRARRGSGAQ